MVRKQHGSQLCLNPSCARYGTTFARDPNSAECLAVSGLAILVNAVLFVRTIGQRVDLLEDAGVCLLEPLGGENTLDFAQSCARRFFASSISLLQKFLVCGRACLLPFCFGVVVVRISLREAHVGQRQPLLPG